jgi:hypothetical protein
MKKALQLTILLLITFLCKSCLWSGPDDPPMTNQDGYYNPVIIERSELESSIKTLPPQSIYKSGKIYIKDDLMFINDVNKGFHVYNYTNPENPILIGFIQTLGATDLAVRGNLIYINQAVDLVTLEYNSSNNTLIEKHRNRNVFPQKTAPNGQYGNASENQIIIDWKLNN